MRFPQDQPHNTTSPCVLGIFLSENPGLWYTHRLSSSCQFIFRLWLRGESVDINNCEWQAPAHEREIKLTE